MRTHKRPSRTASQAEIWSSKNITQLSPSTTLSEDLRAYFASIDEDARCRILGMGENAYVWGRITIAMFIQLDRVGAAHRGEGRKPRWRYAFPATIDESSDVTRSTYSPPGRVMPEISAGPSPSQLDMSPDELETFAAETQQTGPARLQKQAPDRVTQSKTNRGRKAHSDNNSSFQGYQLEAPAVEGRRDVQRLWQGRQLGQRCRLPYGLLAGVTNIWSREKPGRGSNSRPPTRGFLRHAGLATMLLLGATAFS